MADDKNLKKQETALGDEELDNVTGGLKKYSYIGVDSTKYTVVAGTCDNESFRCRICNSPKIMNPQEFVEHIKTLHPEEYHYIS